MNNLVNVLLPVFLVMGAGYLAAWRGMMTDSAIAGLMKFAQAFAIPVILATQMAKMNVWASFHPAPLISFYAGALAAFGLSVVLARSWLGRAPMDAAAIGFCTMFSNSVLLGLPIMERAYGPGSLDGNIAIIALHSPLLFTVGILAMEVARAEGGSLGAVGMSALRGLFRTPMVIGILVGFALNVWINTTGLDLPRPVWDAMNMIGRAGVPAALFGLGGVLHRYRPEGDGRAIAMVVLGSLVLHPGIGYVLGRWVFHLDTAALRSVVLTASMAPGINAYLFADMYGAAKRVAASAVLVATGLSLLTIWLWLAILP